MGRAERFESFLRSKKLSDRYVGEMLIYLKKFGGMSNFNQQYVNSFVKKLHEGGMPRAFIKNFQEYLLERHPDKPQLALVKLRKITGRKKRELPQYVTRNEVKKIAKAMNSERDKLMIWVCFYGGFRRQGLVNLTSNDFLWDLWASDKTKPCKIRVKEKGNIERVVFIPSNLTRRLIKWLREERPTLKSTDKFWQVKADTFYRKIRKASKKALGTPKKVHAIRHGSATWLYENGWDLKEIADYLGHVSVSTTEIYTHIDKKKLFNKYEQLFNSS